MGAASTPAAGSCQNSVLPSCDERSRSAQEHRHEQGRHKAPACTASDAAAGHLVNSTDNGSNSRLDDESVQSEDCLKAPDAAIHEGSHIWVVVREVNGTVRVNDGDADVLLQPQHLPDVLARTAVDEQHCPCGLHKQVCLPDSACIPPAFFQCSPSPLYRTSSGIALPS